MYSDSFFLLVFFLILIGGFACQIYVSSKLNKKQGTLQVVRGIRGGTRTFFQGWQRADELGIKNIMIIWSILVAVMLVIVFIVIGTLILNGPPAKSQ